MAGRTTGTAGCTRLAAQDRHVPKAAVPPALSTSGPRRGGSARIAIHVHVTAPAAGPAIRLVADAVLDGWLPERRIVVDPDFLGVGDGPGPSPGASRA